MVHRELCTRHDKIKKALVKHVRKDEFITNQKQYTWPFQRLPQQHTHIRELQTEQDDPVYCSGRSGV